MTRNAVPEHVPQNLVRDFSIYTSPGMERTPNGCPHAAMGYVHNFPPIFYSPSNAFDGGGTWVVTRAEDQRRILGDPATFSSRRGHFEKSMGEEFVIVPLESDPPAHTFYRTLLNPLLSPKRVEAMEAGARERAVRLIEAFKAKGSCEVMNDFAYPFAVGVFLQFLGIDESRRPEFLGWADELLHGTNEQRQAAMKIVAGFIRDLVEQRKGEPTDDFISFLLKASVEGRALTDPEMVGMGVLMFVGGLDTVAMAIGFDLYHLAREQKDQARLRADHDIIRPAVEELFRAYATITPLRRVTQDTVFDGVPMKKGDVVSCPTMIANRDPSEFPEPDRIDFDRENNRHTTFAYGPHRCIGSHLARRELIIGLEEFLNRIPTFRLKPGEAPITYGGYVFGVENLVLDWT
ncbi:putative cytochrome P450 hydroxylase [alpha proteobacterium U9-1i]|nr:putative cytochrome P450 hydroxylase [alpha proteobacterium U9-1i]